MAMVYPLFNFRPDFSKKTFKTILSLSVYNTSLEKNIQITNIIIKLYIFRKNYGTSNLYRIT